MSDSWEFWIDVGGTFTDCVARAPTGELRCQKVLNRTTGDAPVLAIRRIMGLGEAEPIGAVRVRLGTTRGTNALLERKGAKVAYVTTAGFADLLEIGTQARPHLFKLDIRKPPVLYHEVIELDERIDATGQVLGVLDERQVVERLRPLRQRGIEAVAVCLIHAYLNDAHEQQVARLARGLGFSQVSLSAELSPTIRALDRGDTAVLDAYLSPAIRGYLSAMRSQMPQAQIKVMTSAGGLVEADQFTGRDCLLSGPAGGVVGFADVARRAGFGKAIGFDMGGTSTDVSRFGGQYEYEFSGQKAGVRIVAPMYAIETVAAGGGSICRFDGQRLTVGPDSAGADPGPACYGRGGPLTMTDINFFNGKIDSSRFPFALDRPAVVRAVEELAERSGMTPHEAADGFTRIANLRMATAIRRISTARGYDPAEHVLVAFGGAAGQHACAVARLIGVRQILVHPLAGVLSAYGLGMADVTRFAERSVLQPLSQSTLCNLEPWFEEMATKLGRQIRNAGVHPSCLLPPRRLLDLRYAGEDSAITVERPANGDWAAAFELMHRQLFGHAYTGRAVEVATVRIEVTGQTSKPPTPTYPTRPRRPPPHEHGQVWFNARRCEAGLFDRQKLCPGDRVGGPAIIADPFSTVVVDPGFEAWVTEHGDVLLTASGSPPGRAQPRTQSLACDPVRLELFNSHFTHIATQMGQTLRKTSLSVNVKERLDFSCAILDARGDLVVNAPHIPVHLGAMGEAVKGLLAEVRDLRAGDVYVSNDPDLGGSHLPDVTVMTPVFDAHGKRLRFFAASRAHHAEIGGLRPGSTFPFATNLSQEGVVLRNLRVRRGDQFDESVLRAALQDGPYPSRSPDENVADIRAAVAANHVGETELRRLIEQETWPVVEAYMGHIRAAAAIKTRQAIRRIPRGRYSCEDVLDDGAPVRLALTIDGGRLIADFSGTGPVNANSLNANRSVVQAAVMYCLRCLIDEDIPLNAGVMEPVELIVPASMLNPPACQDPARHAAIAGGNVELSQKIVDLFFGALGIAAASQGTMNNFVFGDRTFGYYETLCGGAGAGATFDGASAVHTHMTNTRLTDVELLERRYPVRVQRFAVRRGTGGAGQHRGGDGVIRQLEFLTSVEVSLLTQRRIRGAFGLRGGRPGLPGRNLLRRFRASADEDIGPLAQFDARPGDVLTILTPGGGGFGPPPGTQ